MSNLQITNILVSMLSASWGLLSVAVNPLTAQEISTTQNNHNLGNLRSSLWVKSFSTKAIDLLQSSSSSSGAGNLQPGNEIAQGELNLKEFCQNYPYNSQCMEVTPATESETGDRSPIPVPTLPPTSNRQDPDSNQKSGWAIVPEASTLGLGGQIVRKITPNFNARVGVNGFGLGIDIEETEIDYEGDLNLFNVSTIVDIHPFKKSGFRVSGGLILSDNSFDGTADISEQVAEEIGEVEIEGQSVGISELNINELATLDADIDLNNSVAPYLGIGGGNAVGEGKGLGFWWNLGVVLGGSPEVEITTNIAEEVPETVREEVEAAADQVIEDEEEDLEDELDFINIYPVVSLGFSYQF
ncbi:MAG: hypothetical protein AAGA16_02775 [Cyanobacteria bacterium P01_E01_bin.35]